MAAAAGKSLLGGAGTSGKVATEGSSLMMAVVEDDDDEDAGGGAAGAGGGAAWGDDADLNIGADGEVITTGGGFGEDDDDLLMQDALGDEDEGGGAGEAGWDTEDLDIQDLPAGVSGAAGAGAAGGGAGSEAYFVAPTRGSPHGHHWTAASKLAVDHVLAGSFESACRLLHEQVGVTNFAPLRALFLATYGRSRAAYQPLATLPPLLKCHPQRNPSEDHLKGLPATALRLADLIGARGLQAAYQLTTLGRFAEAVERFRSLLHSTLLLAVDSKQELLEAKQLLEVAREYTLGLVMEMDRKALPKEEAASEHSSAIRSAELAAYFTHLRLQPVHLMLTLRTAMNLLFKLKNYRTAASMARRLLELGPKADVATKTRQVLLACEKAVKAAEATSSSGEGAGDLHPLDYSQHNPFAVCAASYTPIYRGKPEVKCPLCSASYRPEHAGTVCRVCLLAEVGREDVLGLRISAAQFR